MLSKLALFGDEVERSSGRKTLVCVTDVPTPYRTHLFERLSKVCSRHGIEFEVLFMALTVPHRFWPFEPAEMRYRFRIFSGVHPRIGGLTYHFNPGILRSITARQPSWLLIGGGWHIPTAFLLVFWQRFLNPKTWNILWTEANHPSSRYRNGPVAKFRRAVAARVQAFAIPGRIAEETVTGEWRITNKPFIRLPNLVDEEAFTVGVDSLRAQANAVRTKRCLNQGDLVMLWPARLHEGTKGILNFLKTVADLIPPQMQILIAGEGPDRKDIEDWLQTTGLHSNVRLLGQQSPAEMLELFAVADVFLLPSVRDPNPLSVIEALWSGLPLFISDRCGNWQETLRPGFNGWLFPPDFPTSLQKAFLEMVNLPRVELRGYGRNSRLIAQKEFATDAALNDFVAQLMELPS